MKMNESYLRNIRKFAESKRPKLGSFSITGVTAMDGLYSTLVKCLQWFRSKIKPAWSLLGNVSDITRDYEY